MKTKQGLAGVLVSLATVTGLFLTDISAHAAELIATENTSKPTGTDSTRNVNIYRIVVDGTTCFAELLDTRQQSVVPNFTDNFNGNAFDTQSCRFYYSRFDRDPGDLLGDDPNPFFFYDVPTNSTVQVSNLDRGAASGAFFDGDYYYIANRSTELLKVSFNADGTVFNESTVCFINLAGDVLAFGDLTFDPNNPGTIFGSATKVQIQGFIPQFFRIDNLDCTTYTEISTNDQFGAGALQIAFGLSDGILYGHSARDGRFFSINTSDGVQNLVCNALSKNDPTQVNPTGDFGGIDPEIIKLSDLTEGKCDIQVFDGCAPGFWKQKHHFNSWVVQQPSDLFEDVFGVDASFDDDDRTVTLEMALKLGGGGESALARHAVAALLNANSPDVFYTYVDFQIIQIVQDAYGSADFEGAKNNLENANEQICPLVRTAEQ